MKITDEMIDRYAQEYCRKHANTQQIITSEEVAYHFFLDQDTEDILNYTNSRKPLDEVYLTQAMIECADRAGLVREWMHPFDPDDTLWHKISWILRKQIRAQKQVDSI